MRRTGAWGAFLPLVLLCACGEAAPGTGGGGQAPDGGVEQSPNGGVEQPAEAATPTDSGPAVAITIDDLPWVGPLPPGWSRMDGTERILAALEEHQAPATGFVNCGRAAPGAPVLTRWVDAGHRLGNHTQQHLDLNHADPSAWAADAAECDRFLRERTRASAGNAILTFRYPYLHRGPTPERYAAGMVALTALETVIAPVTINTGDWILDDPYVAAVRGSDEARVETITSTYVEHVLRATAHYREVARERLGRDVPHILLLHANALLAAELGTVLARLEAEGFRFVTLEEALRDPVYDMEDDYIGPEGLSWLYRIPPADPSAQAWDREEAARLREIVR